MFNKYSQVFPPCAAADDVMMYCSLPLTYCTNSR